ncbi:glycogen debranching protein GlgX [Rouxiella badensis]|uniref:glycogen debranching protein GlgX n=1 Tax=Rouxiella badensis TaxID=1646377 RepID=UPI001B779BBA|nr:glycogen debranching protein GlgX [Rouxiella badensis]MCC3702762.1 glycogen debranching protein GlgX [Rouxiella badensis]MCC3748253.1 glycogen debranching protein GlgX [Rouxiella badensis]
MASLQPGKPAPFGASFDGDGVNFCVFSSGAEKIELCLFDEKGAEARLPLPSRTGNLWHGYLPGAQVGLRYGFRAHGPFDPAKGLRFNAQKLLLDPSAHALEGGLGDDSRLCGGVKVADPRDSADLVPKSVVTHDHFDWQDDAAPAVPWGETVIYEAHVRGLTQLHPDIPEALRGTYAALGHPVMLDYFKRLGITALELLPVQHHADEPRLQHMGLSNYWGYNVLAPCALEPSYASGVNGVSAAHEFKTAIRALHQAGIEVLIDVVFNHTAELDVEGPTVSLRGLDNRSWYWLNDDGSDNNLTGCGNAMRLVDDEVVAWTLESLRYWVESFHVDGFRFDLGTMLGRTPKFHADSALFKAIKADPVLGHCKLIAEPWDIGPDGYQVGNFPAPFAEWSDHWRDDIRRFWLYGTLPIGDFATRFAASADIFDHDGRLPSAAVNMLTAHDGFNLRDLVSFNDKHNQANGEDNRDGHDNNYSQNHGQEGLEVSEEVAKQRRLSQRALLATLFLSQGTPMLLAGDEFGHSQQGNNNAYCQNNALTWLNWRDGDKGLTEYVSALISLRKKIPALTQNSWWQGMPEDVQWLDGAGQPMTTTSWEQSGQQCLQIRLSDRWLLVVNSSLNDVEMALPEGRWLCVAPFDNEQQNVREGSPWRATAKTLCVMTQG